MKIIFYEKNGNSKSNDGVAEVKRKGGRNILTKNFPSIIQAEVFNEKLRVKKNFVKELLSSFAGLEDIVAIQVIK